jgi:UDP-glucose 4-epimerase
VKVLITGGAGYIGSTVASACADAGHQPIVLDDLSTGRVEFADRFPFYRADVADREVLERIYDDHPDLAAVVHCAAKIVVPDSVADPLGYYENNVGKTLGLLSSLARLGVDRVVFSSSASVYASTPDQAVTEESPTAPQSPYARTKLMMEQVLADAAATGRFRVIALRYFNPVGADPVLRTGQQLAHPSHVMGKLIEAHCSGEPFTITGTDWPTRDGTAIRDFIHVWDLARAHVAAIERFDQVTGHEPFQTINLGTGRGTTVGELVVAFSEGSGAYIDVLEGDPRPGDVRGAYAVADRARQVLGWQAELTPADGVRDSLRWLARRPLVLGY